MSIARSGSSSGGSLAKRVARLEYALSKFSEHRVILRDTFGKNKKFSIIAKRQTKDDFVAGLPPFSLIDLNKDGQAYKVIIAVGWLRDIITRGGENADGILFLMPKVGKDSLDADPPPEISMRVGDTLYCNFKTDKTGNVTGDAKILAEKKTQKTVHYQPDVDGEGGAEGNYWIKLGKLEAKGEGVLWRQYQNSDIEHYHELPTFRNVGDGSAVIKERDAALDQYEVRRIRGLYGMSDTQEADRVTLDVDIENVGDGQKLIVTPDEGSNKGSDGPVQVRTIRAAKPEDYSASGGGSPQIRVETSENSIVVKGNNKNGSLAWEDCDGNVTTLLEWSDGLITTDAAEPIKFVAGCDGSSSNSGS